MNTYKVFFTITKLGLFSDTKFEGIDHVEAETEKEAWELKEEEAGRKTIPGQVICMVNNIEKVEE